MSADTNQAALLERAMQPQNGDTYTRSDSRVTVKVITVFDHHVVLKYAEDGEASFTNQIPLEDFRRLARKSIESGGRFEPAK